MSFSPLTAQAIEARALRLGTAGNIFGAAAALVFFLRSGSDALLLDGLYTAVLAGASALAGQVNRTALQPRNRAYPFGASGQEPLYVLFQTLVLLGMIAFAMASAAGKVLSALQGAAIAPPRLEGLGWYFAAMVLLNLVLWRLFQDSWRRSGGISTVLHGMAQSARFDAAISAGTGVVLLGSPLLTATALAPLVPISDGLLVLLLSVLFLPGPIASLRQAIAESAGAGVDEELRQRCGERLSRELPQHRCTLLELAMIRLGRTHTVVAYVTPAGALTAEEVDGLRRWLEGRMREWLGTPVLCEVIPSADHPYGPSGDPLGGTG
ncbi:MAG: cation transporter [Synechococcaceae cyanobacterium]|nr:cation transporter [Synechococcaceae cyanobacterium]